MRRWFSELRWQTLLPLFVLYYFLAVTLSWLSHTLLALALLFVNLVFVLALISPSTRAWGRRMLRHSFVLLALAALYAFFPGLPVSARSAVKLVGPEGGQVMTPDRMARMVVGPGSFPVPLLLKVTSLPLTTPLPDPALPPEVKLIAAAHFEQSHPFPEEWQNFFMPEVQLSLKNAVAPVEGGSYFTEICFWVSPEEMIHPQQKGSWFCDGPHTIRSGDPTQKGSGWVATTVKGFGPEGTTFYLFQYPRDWARANCEAAGGRFNENVYGSFFHACSHIDLRYYDLSLGQVIYNPLDDQRRGLKTKIVLLSDDYGLKSTTWNVGNTKSANYYKLYKENDIKEVGKELRRTNPDILHLQEVFVESTYCVAHPNAKICQNLDTPVIERVLESWKGADWRSELDYVCMQYECTIVKKRTASGLTLEFLDKSDPMYTNYITGVEGEDTGYLFAMLKMTYPGGKEEFLASFNEHTATPAKGYAGITARAAQFRAQREHILDLLEGGGGLPYDTLGLRPQGTGPGGYHGPPPDGILKMGDFNVHLIPDLDGSPGEWLANKDDLALQELVGTVGEDGHLEGFFAEDEAKSRAFGQRRPALLWRVGRDDYFTGYFKAIWRLKWVPISTDMVASNRYVGSCGVTRDLARSVRYGFDHNPVVCDLEPVKTRKFTGAAERGGQNMPYAGNGAGPSARAGTLFPNKGLGYGPGGGPYRATFFDVGASFPATFNPDGTFTFEVPEHILAAGLPVFVRFCVPQLGCKVVRLDPNNPNFTIPFNDDCDEQSAQSASVVR